MPITAPESIKDRFDAYRFFNGMAIEGKEGLDAAHTRIPLVKTFLIEHVSGTSGRKPKSPAEIFSPLRAKLGRIDDTFHSVQVPDENVRGTPKPLVTTGFLEQYDERFFAYYTVQHSEDARKLVRRWITQSPDIDSAWFSGQLLQSLWDLHELQDDTDPSPLLLIFSDQDCPNPERAGYYRRVLVNQVVAKLVADLHLLPLEQPYSITARELLLHTSDGILNYLARDRQKNMINIVRQNVFARIASSWRDKSFTPVQLEGDRLQINFKDNLAKEPFMDWLEDPKKTAFVDTLPPTNQPLLPGIEPPQKGAT